MIILDDMTNCTGCGICGSLCPQSAIEMVARGSGFFYPQINSLQCTECGLCRRKCPQNSGKRMLSRVAYAAYSSENEVRLGSSSGGVFSELCRSIIGSGGVVCAVRYGTNWLPEFAIATTIEDCQPFKISKYAEAQVRFIYESLGQYVLSGVPVLFVGTPCQVAGVKMRFPKADNLVTVDLICKGVPSSKLFAAYLSEYTKRFGDILSINMRLKRPSWEQSSWQINSSNFVFFSFENKESKRNRFADSYRSMFGSALSLRPSCYTCSYRGKLRAGDITIGDFWHIDALKNRAIDSKDGVSLVFVNSELGEKLWSQARLYQYRYTIEEIERAGCMQSKNPIKPKVYDKFWVDFERKGYECVAKKYTVYGEKKYLRHRVARVIKGILKKIMCK